MTPTTAEPPSQVVQDDPVTPLPTDDPTPVMLPPLNEGDDLTRLLDRTDDDCSISMAAAIALYGEPDVRDSEFFPDNFGGGITLATLLWSGISTELELRSGEALDGCSIAYSRGGPSIDVPAIETTPDPALPTSTAEAVVAASTGERTLVLDDPECVDTFTALLRRYGELDGVTTFGPETSDDGATLVLLSWPGANASLEYGPSVDGCEVTAFPAPDGSDRPAATPPSDGAPDPIVVLGDPTCVDSIVVSRAELGPETRLQFLFADETLSGLAEVVLYYESEGVQVALQLAPIVDACIIDVEPIGPR